MNTKISLVLATCAALLGPSCFAAAPAPDWRDGDIVFHSSRTEQSEAIGRATKSPYTHVGLVFLRDGRPMVLEAVGPVKWTGLDEWIARGVDGKFVVKRPADAALLDREGASARLRSEAERFLGRPYDPHFGWSDDRIYCSELVWKAYSSALGIELGTPERLRDFDLSDPVVAAKLAERYGDDVPLDEIVVSPARMFASPALTLVNIP